MFFAATPTAKGKKSYDRTDPRSLFVFGLIATIIFCTFLLNRYIGLEKFTANQTRILSPLYSPQRGSSEPAALSAALTSQKKAVAVCLIGEVRTLSQTAPNIKRFLTDVWGADIFVFLKTQSTATAADWAAAAMLGDNVKMAKIGSDEEIFSEHLHQTLSLLLGSEGLKRSLYYTNEPREEWLDRLGGMLVNIYGCSELIKAYEEESGLAYDIKARVRSDTLLFEPIAAGFLEEVNNHTAVIPSGEEWGAPGGRGANDRFLVGGRFAFDVDAHRYRDVLAGTDAARPRWISEWLMKRNLELNGVGLVQKDLSYCILKPEGHCKYPAELMRSTFGSERKRDERSPVAKCPSLCKPFLLEAATCDPKRSVFSDDASKELDPGFCGLARRCVVAAKGRNSRELHSECNKLMGVDDLPPVHRGLFEAARRRVL